MAKGSRGGKRTAGGAGAAGAANATQSGAAQQAQVDTTQPVQAMSASYSAFQAMTDDEKADYIDNMVSQGVPDHLSQSAFQKFVYNSDMNDKPQVVDDKTLDGMGGTEMFRTVDAVNNNQVRVKYSADEIANQVMYGTKTRYSDSGGSVHGRGLYFATSYTDSVGYGSRSGNIKATAVMRAKLNANAKTITTSAVSRLTQQEIASGSKLGKSLQKIYRSDTASAWSLCALAKGYNVIDSGWGYYNVLNRNAMTMSSTVKSKGGSW